MGGSGVDAKPRNAERTRPSAGRVRIASRLVAPCPRGAQSLAELSRTGACRERLRQRDGLHPRRADAHHGASVLRLLGLPGHWLFRANVALWHAAGFHVLRGLPAPPRNRRNPRLGALAFSLG